MRPIPRDPLNPGEDGLPEGFIENPNISRKVRAPGKDKKAERSQQDYPGEQHEEEGHDEESDSYLDPDGDPSRSPHAD